MKFLPALLVAACAITFQTQALAQDWPTRSVRILVGSAPGGGTDAMARAVADRLGPLLKQAVVVENRPGASNILAADVTVQGGLPIPITTPAHGTAYDIAGQGVADVNATLNAFRIACRMGAARLQP